MAKAYAEQLRTVPAAEKSEPNPFLDPVVKAGSAKQEQKQKEEHQAPKTEPAPATKPESTPPHSEDAPAAAKSSSTSAHTAASTSSSVPAATTSQAKTEEGKKKGMGGIFSNLKERTAKFTNKIIAMAPSNQGGGGGGDAGEEDIADGLARGIDSLLDGDIAAAMDGVSEEVYLLNDDPEVVFTDPGRCFCLLAGVSGASAGAAVSKRDLKGAAAETLAQAHKLTRDAFYKHFQGLPSVGNAAFADDIFDGIAKGDKEVSYPTFKAFTKQLLRARHPVDEEWDKVRENYFLFYFIYLINY